MRTYQEREGAGGEEGWCAAKKGLYLLRQSLGGELFSSHRDVGGGRKRRERVLSAFDRTSSLAIDFRSQTALVTRL